MPCSPIRIGGVISYCMKMNLSLNQQNLEIDEKENKLSECMYPRARLITLSPSNRYHPPIPRSYYSVKFVFFAPIHGQISLLCPLF